MKAVFDFLRAALPWIAVGLLLAVFFARNAKRTSRGSRNRGNETKAHSIVKEEYK